MIDNTKVSNRKMINIAVDTETYIKMRTWVWRQKRRTELVLNDAFCQYLDVLEGKKELVDVDPEATEAEPVANPIAVSNGELQEAS